jgi:hypothetical protein
MGEAKWRRDQGLTTPNEHASHVVKAKRVRVVPNIRLQNVDADRVVMLMLGEQEPELAAGLSASDARQLAGALLQHAEQLEKDAPRIILPGSTLTP